MAIIVRLDGEMPPVVVPPYSLNGTSKVSEVLEATCRFFKRPADESQLVDAGSGKVLDNLDEQLKTYGIDHWSMLTLRPTSPRTYKRVTFGG